MSILVPSDAMEGGSATGFDGDARVELLIDRDGLVVGCRCEGGGAALFDGALLEGVPITDILDEADAEAIAGILERDLAACGTLTLDLRAGEVRVPLIAEVRRIGAFAHVVGEPRRAAETSTVTPDRLAQRRLEEIGVLSSGIAHDFNNILSAILGNAELLAETLPPVLDAGQSDLLEAAADIITAAQRSRELIGQMLGYAVRARVEPGLVDLNALALEMSRLLRVSIPNTVVFDHDLARDLPRVRGEPSQLRQVILNLIVNAADAIGEQVGSVAIRTASFFAERSFLDGAIGGASLSEGDYAAIEVADTGAGMSPATIARIFEPFFTTKSKGHGLGLAGVRAIVAGHGGAIRVRSSPGLGTTMQVLLPAVAAVATDGRAAASGPMTDLFGRTVLVIDDEAMVLRVTRRILEARGVRVIAAEDGHAGIEAFLAESATIDCVLLDVSMPYIHGLDVFRELALIRPVPVVLISGFSGEEIQRRARGLGVAGFLQKPFSAADLVAAIVEAITGEGAS